MSRGGRGGGGAGRQLPFALDPDLEELAQFKRGDGDDPFVLKDLFQDANEVVVQPGPITDRERKVVQKHRTMLAKRRAGPFWTGTREDWDEDGDGDAKAGEELDIFNNAPTYGRKRERKGFQMVNPKKIKIIKEFFPKELQDIFADAPTDASAPNANGTATSAPQLGLAKKSALDKLAKFDDEDDDAPRGGADDVDEEEEKDADADAEAEPQDDDFDEDEDDADNDYNAEQFFDNGEDDFDEGGGEEFGGGDDGY